MVVLSLAAIRERLIFEYPIKREEMKKEINDLLQQKETLKELFEKAELLSQPGKVYQLFDNTNKQKLIEEKNG